MYADPLNVRWKLQIWQQVVTTEHCMSHKLIQQVTSGFVSKPLSVLPHYKLQMADDTKQAMCKIKLEYNKQTTDYIKTTIFCPNEIK